MDSDFLSALRCPITKQRLMLVESPDAGTDDTETELRSEDGSHSYPVIDGIPRFVPQSNYADNFGKQWNEFRLTQLDSHSGHPITAKRFWKATGWSPSDIEGQWVLDIGCGAGRFAEIALEAGAKVVALDYSSAVDACKKNLDRHENLYLVQGDIYALPFDLAQFKFVYSLGVLQHTPNVERSFHSLVTMASVGGSVCVDFYWKRLRTMMHAKYLFRPITKRLDSERLLNYIKASAPALLATSRFLGSIPLIGVGLKRLVPVADYTGRYPLSEKQLLEWAILDTFDMLAPEYDNPQDEATIGSWARKSGLEQVEIFHEGHLVLRGKAAS